MQKPLRASLLAFAAAAPALLFSQSIYFANKTNLLPSASFHSGNGVGVCDMNGDGKDDIVRADNNTTMYIEYQQAPNDTFTESSFIAQIGDPWGMCVGDIDNNGYNDVLWGDYGATRILTANSTGTNYISTDVSTLTGAGFIFVQGCNFSDINNDGKLDAFVCDDIAMPHIFIGNGTMTGWTFNQSVMPLATVPASDNSGNYASVWTDVNNDGLIDLMITHCRQSVSNSNDPRRIDQIFINNGNGTYTQDVTNWTNLRDGAQGWSTAWGDVDNDGDMDAFVLNYDVNSKLMINNGSGVFTNMMASSGISNTTSFFGMNATFQDFDNDGFVDLLLTGDNHYLYRNNGNGTFTQVTSPFVYSTYTITSHAVGDLNGDGFLDVYGSYCDVYQSPSAREDRLWMNDCPANGNTNHWVKFNLTGVASNKNGIGAIVKIYGPWGVQVREVRSGEAYGIQNSFTMHFGLGNNTSIDSVIVHWPSGTIDHVNALGGDQTYTLVEGANPASVQNFDAQQFALNVFPNPSNDVTFIRVDHFAQYGLNNLSVNIYDVNGKLVYNESALQNSIISIDRNLLKSGVYFVEVRNKEKRLATQQLVIE